MVYEEKVLVCRDCKREFKFSLSEIEFYEQKGFSEPTRCPKCRKAKRETANSRHCSGCETELTAEAPVFCSTCLKNIELEYEMKTGQTQQATAEALNQLKSLGTEKAELAEIYQEKENLVKDLENKVKALTEETEKISQLYSTLDEWFKPTMNDMENRLIQRLEVLKQRQHEIQQTMLQITKVMQDLQETQKNITLLEVLKNSFRGYQRRNTQAT